MIVIHIARLEHGRLRCDSGRGGVISNSTSAFTLLQVQKVKY